jgi:hypothetical protein
MVESLPDYYYEVHTWNWKHTGSRTALRSIVGGLLAWSNPCLITIMKHTGSWTALRSIVWGLLAWSNPCLIIFFKDEAHLKAESDSVQVDRLLAWSNPCMIIFL